ncbi:S28 family serine protease [Streptomyces sp. Lzd4kr]|nr:S28 family serine protease [Streptomyces sp. Lzd4kr]
MRSRALIRWLLSLAMLTGALGLGAAGPAAATGGTGTDILDKLEAIPGMTVVSESTPSPQHRFFVLGYEQPVDHANPSAGTFVQRVTLLHRSESRPMVLETSGYDLYTSPYRAEVTRLLDGNQLSTEQRYFGESRPADPTWSKLNIFQAAADHHRLVEALKPVYTAKWISTGVSKGGMTSVYHRRFFPDDVDGTVAYASPNDVVDSDDSAYDQFFEQVGNEECRNDLDAIQREAFVRREPMVERYKAWAQDAGATFELTGSADEAYESVLLDLVFVFWQYGSEADCDSVPPITATTDEIYDFVDAVVGFYFYTDQVLDPYGPFFFQAGTQIGYPTLVNPHLSGLLKYPGTNLPRNFVPDSIPMTYDDAAMADVDTWVQDQASEVMFIYGSADPFSSEPFHITVGPNGQSVRDTWRYTVDGGNHLSNIADLPDTEKAAATADLRRWAGVDSSVALLGERFPQLDARPAALERRPL